MIGAVVDGRYRVEAVLGRGGMGAVYKAVQTSVERHVALKVIAGEVNDQAVARFLREAKTTSALRSVNTVTLHDFGRTPDDLLYLAMELLEGVGLDTLLRAQGRLPWRRALRIAGQVALSLEEAHSRGIVHRDLKPSNVFLVQMGDDPDFVKVLDFGIAKLEGMQATTDLTGSGNVLGTPTYMSPEQARAEQVDGRSDLYSLGIILYQMLAGRPPFTAPQPLSLLLLHCQARVPSLRDTDPPLDAPSGVIDLVEGLLVKDREKRIGTATEVRRTIKSLLGEPTTGPFPAVTTEVSGTDATLLTPLTPRMTAAPLLPPLDDPETLGRSTGVQHPARRRSGLAVAAGAVGVLLVAVLLVVFVILPSDRGGSAGAAAGQVPTPAGDRAQEERAAEESAAEEAAPLEAAAAPEPDHSPLAAGEAVHPTVAPESPPVTAQAGARGSAEQPTRPGASDAALAPAGDAVPAPPTAAADAPPAPSEILKLVSDPPGAEVRDRSGKLLGSTPLELPAPDAAASLVLSQTGYQRLRVKVERGQSGELAVELRKAKARTARPEDEPILDLMD